MHERRRRKILRRRSCAIILQCSPRRAKENGNPWQLDGAGLCESSRLLQQRPAQTLFCLRQNAENVVDLKRDIKKDMRV